MKKFLLLFLAVLFYGSVFAAAPKAFPDTRAGALTLMGGYPGYNAKTAEAFAAYMRTGTHRELLNAYAGKAPDPAFATYAAREIYTSKKLGAALIAGFEQLAETATKAQDPRASIYRRAGEKLAQQLKESGLRQDAQAAVADAIKALEEKA